MPIVSYLRRGRFLDLPQATATKIGGNAWQIRIPGAGDPQDWDEVVFLIDDVETQPAVGSGGGQGYVLVTALVL